MKKIILLICVLQVFLLNIISAQDYIITITNKVSAYPNFTFDVYMSNATGNSGTTYIGNSDFHFTYNTTYLNTPSSPTFDNFTTAADVKSSGTDMVVNVPANGRAQCYKIVGSTPVFICSGKFIMSQPQTGGAFDNIVCNSSNSIAKIIDNTNTDVAVSSYSCNAGSNIVLPLTLLDFTAKPQKDNITLNWQTANEINFSGFELQRGTDAQNFSTVAEVKGKGFGDYVYNDFKIVAGQIYYYRLKMNDRNGDVNYSPIKSALIEGTTSAKLFPNPTTTGTRLNIYSPTESDAVVKIFNTQGQLLQTIPTHVSAGQNDLPIDLSYLASGVYYVVMNLNNQQFSFKANKIE